MNLKPNCSEQFNVVLEVDENNSMYRIPEGFVLASITLLYVKPGTDESFTTTQKVGDQ